MHNRLAYVALLSLFGIVLAYFTFPFFFLLLTLSFIIYLFFRGKMLGISCLIALVVFSLHYLFHERENKSLFTENDTAFSGRIITRPEFNGSQLTFIFETKVGERLYFTFKADTKEEKESLSLLRNRDSCVFQGELRQPGPSRNFFQFDFAQYLYWNKIHWMVSPTSLTISNCDRNQVNLLDKIHIGRDQSLLFIEKHFPTPLNGFVQALIFGERGLLDEAILESYQKLGLIHLLAISGMHVSLICTFIYFLAVRLGLTKEKTTLLMMVILPLYVLIAGCSPSVIRAAIMTFLVLFKIRFRFIPFTTLDLISIAFIVMVFFNPYYIFQAGFQLSFTVTYALILSSQTILNKYNHFLAQLTAASAISQISSLPLILYHFYEFSLLSIPLNLLYIPVLTFIILPLCFFHFFIQILFPNAGSILLPITNELLKITNNIAVNVAENNWQLLVLGRPSGYMISLYILITIYTFIQWEKSVKRSISIWLLLLLLLSFHFTFPYLKSTGEITMIDVGQGDSILIELPYRKEVYLIDTGGTVSYALEEWEQKTSMYSISNDVIIPYLKAKGIRKIDKLILTHSDLDHIGEAVNLLNKMRVLNVMIGDFHDKSELELQVLQAAKDNKVEVVKVKSGFEWKVSKYQFKVLAPFKYYSDSNEGSIVLSASLGGKVWLFTGDIEDKGESDLIKLYPSLEVDVLKVSHHGSNTSTSREFLQAFNPEAGLISAGVNNRYGHPNNEVLNRLQEYGVKIFRTDQNGAIQYTFEDNSVGTFLTKIPYNKVKEGAILEKWHQKRD